MIGEVCIPQASVAEKLAVKGISVSVSVSVSVSSLYNVSWPHEVLCMYGTAIRVMSSTIAIGFLSP